MKSIEIGQSPERVANLLKKYVNSKCEGSIWFQDIGKMPTMYDVLFAIDILDNMEAREEMAIEDPEEKKTEEPIETLELQKKTYNILTKNEIRTVEGLCNRTMNDLVKMRGVGKQMIDEVTRALAERGLELRKESV